MKQNYNNNSLARLGHGKWKSALGHTLLIIGLVLGIGGMNVWAQDPIPEAVKLDKQFIPDDPTGHSGKIVLETYVTGKVTQVTASQPTDIVLVLDYSQSMNSSYPGATSRREALEQSVQGFVEAIQEDAETNGCEHRMAVVKFSSQAETSLLSTESHYTYDQFNTARYQEALVTVNVNHAVNPLLTNSSLFDGVSVNNGTVMNAGMATAYQIFLARAQSGGGGTTFVVPNQTPTTELPRNMVVVFFTDGFPTAQYGYDETNLARYWQANRDMDDVADATCLQAANIKNISITSGGSTIKPTIFSIGIYSGCDPEVAYQTTYQTNGGGRWSTGIQCLNGLLHFISSDYDETLTSWSDNTTITDFRNEEHYLAPQDANDLIEAFGKITSSAGGTPVNLGSNTVVQDIISPSFQLPEGTSLTDIKVYAPKLDHIKNGKYYFEDTDDSGTLELGDSTVVNQGQTVVHHGVVVDGGENRLPLSYTYTENGETVTINVVDFGDDEKTIRITGFDFSIHFCGPITEGNDTTGYTGRKLYIEFPIEIEEGVWGDGINTNGELSFVTPDGTIKYQFPMPSANVLGDVWTEIITEEPDGFDPMDIDSPEDLAWFISYVNGRAGYEQNDTVRSRPAANGKLTADIDMSAHNWVPIGSGWVNANGETTNTRMSYQGEFDGNGHVITGLKNNASKYYKKVNDQTPGVVVFPGMFSDIDGGTVHDVFVLDADFRGKHHDQFFVHHGIIADTLTSGTIYNCEAAGRITCNNDRPDLDQNLIYGGLVGLNKGTIYNSMAMAELTGYTLGGAVGENRGGSFSNSFTNGVYNYIGENGANAKPVGGLVGENGGTISNCYVRFERNNLNLDKASFGMLYGSDKVVYEGTLYEGSDEYCYIPQMWTFTRPTTTSTTSETHLNPTVPTSAAHPDENPANSYTLSITPTFYNMFINDNMTGGTWGTWNGFNVYQNGTPLVEILNEHKGRNGATWKRTTAGAYSTGAGDINDDFPVLQLPGYTCLGSADGIRIDYAHNLNDMLHRHNNGKLNENTQISNGYTQNNSNFYKKTAHAAIHKGSINLFANDEVTAPTTGGSKDDVADNCTAEGVVVYIDENISLLQDDNSSIEAYTGQTLKAFDNTDTQAGERWHNISSSLSNSQFGWTYENYSAHNWDANPCGWTLPNTDEDHAFFPVDIFSYHRAEFYCFLERAYHWINFRRRSDSHWHMDNYELNIPYPEQEDHFIPGKGYLSNVDMSMWWSRKINGTTYSKQAQFMQNRGTLNNGDVEIDVTADAPEWTGLKGYNLLGNPYQSFLDFDAFVAGNATLMANSDFANTYAVYDPNEGNYTQYMKQSSKGSRAAGRYLNMHQGFFIQVNEGGTATFTNAMRTNDAEPNFRGEQPAYPLINFILTDKGGNNDLAILELNRPENDGARKLRVGNSTGRIYFRYDNENLAIYFRNSDKDYQSLNFAAEEDGNFTLSWERANDNFNSLTLVDNVTGIKTDMLTHDHYTFEGRVSDYNSRFKIVFGEMDTNEEEPVLEHFAFFDHGNLIVNGTGHFEVVDVLGRVVYSAELTDTQNTVSLPSNVRGVCMLCFTRNNEMKVQKMVIQ